MAFFRKERNCGKQKFVHTLIKGHHMPFDGTHVPESTESADAVFRVIIGLPGN
jgi:hypothetical protein